MAVSADREQCKTNADCQKFASNTVCVTNVCQAVAVIQEAGVDAEAGPTDPVWGCLGNVPTLLEKTSEKADIQYVLLGSDQKRLGNFTVKLCRSADLGCLNPVGQYVTDAEGTETQGTVTLPVYTGFRGYIESVPSEAYPDLIPFRAYVPIVNPDIPTTIGRTFLTVFSKAQLGLVATILSTEPNPALGHIIFTARDCQNGLASDVVATTGEETDESTTFYLDSNGAPTRDQTATSVPGVGGIFNLKVKSLTLKAERKGQYVGSASVVISAGTVTYVNAIPTPGGP